MLKSSSRLLPEKFSLSPISETNASEKFKTNTVYTDDPKKLRLFTQNVGVVLFAGKPAQRT